MVGCFAFCGSLAFCYRDVCPGGDNCQFNVPIAEIVQCYLL